MKQLHGLTGKRLAGAVLIVSGLFFSSLVVASIVSGSFTTSSSTNVTITNLLMNKPSGVTQGDLLLASVAIHDGNSVSVTAPGGWTQILRTDNDTSIGIATYWKVAGASEPTNYTWVLSPQTRAQGSITRYSGVDPSNPIDVAAGNIGRSKIATTTSITTASANEEIVAVYALHVGSANFAGDFFSVPAGMTEKYDSSYTNAGPTIATFDAAQASSSVVGSKSSTISGNPNQQRDWAAQTIALRMVAPANALHLVSTSSQYGFVSPSSQTGLDIGGDLSLDTWVKFDSFPSGYNYHLISRWDNSLGHGTYRLYTYDPGDGSKLLGIGVAGGGFCELPVSLTPGVWYHIVGTWNNSTYAENLYLNGTSVGNCVGSGSIVTGIADEFDIGAFYDNPGHSEYLNGLIKDARVWTKELSATEVANQYSSPCAVPTTNLLSWWKFAGNANDSIGSNNLTLVNSPTYQADAPYSCSL